MTTLEKIRKEILDYFLWDGQSVDNLPLYVRRVLNIIDKYAEQEPCDDCEVGNPCLYCEHEFKDKRIEQMCKDCIHAGVYGANSMKCTLRDEIVFNDGRCNSFEPKVNEPCEDAVSRQAVDTLVDELARAISYERCCMARGRSTATIMQNILDLPSVRPQEPKTGHWIDTDEGFSPCECSECGKVEFKKSDYCPNCGAKMVEPQESEEV